MRIKVINPNTTLEMTEGIGEAARSVAAHPDAPAVLSAPPTDLLHELQSLVREVIAI